MIRKKRYPEDNQVNDDAYQIDYPEGFKFDHDDDDMDMGSITDSLLTDHYSVKS